MSKVKNDKIYHFYFIILILFCNFANDLMIIKVSNMKTIIYARVSTNSQDYERQIADLREYESQRSQESCRA